MRAMYLFCHKHRTIVSFHRAIRVAGWLAPLRGRRHGWSAAEIGRRVAAVEHSVGFSDCYPRALLTAWLCLAADLDCELTIGILAPTSRCMRGAQREARYRTNPCPSTGSTARSSFSMSHADAPPETAPARVASCEEGLLRLDIRPAVAVRRVAARGYALFSLKLVRGRDRAPPRYVSRSCAAEHVDGGSSCARRAPARTD